jgi:hypothetical protein
MHGGGVLYDRKDPEGVAALIDSVLCDQSTRDAILASQDAALDRLLGYDFAGTLLGQVEAASPRRGVSRAWRRISGRRSTPTSG